MNAADLKPHILEVLDDGESMSSKWIRNRLRQQGIEVSTYVVSRACQDLASEGKLIMGEKHCTGLEWKVVSC